MLLINPYFFIALWGGGEKEAGATCMQKPGKRQVRVDGSLISQWATALEGHWRPGATITKLDQLWQNLRELLGSDPSSAMVMGVNSSIVLSHTTASFQGEGLNKLMSIACTMELSDPHSA